MTIEWPERPSSWTAGVDAYYGALFGPRIPVDREALIAVVDDLAHLFPTDAASDIRARADAFLATAPDSEAALDHLRSLKRKAVEVGLDERFFRPDRRSPRRDFGGLVDDVNRREAGTRRVVFFATTPYFLIARESLYLRRRGYRTHLICMDVLSDDTMAFFRRHFDVVVDGCNSGRLLRGLVRQLRPDVFHVQCWMFNYVLGSLVVNNRGETPVVCEFYDITSLYAEAADLRELWGGARVDADLAHERHIVRTAQGVVHRFPPPIAARWLERHGSTVPNIELQNYPCPDFSVIDEAKRPADRPIRLIYGGSLVPRDENHPPHLFPEAGFPRTFASLLEQGFAVDVFHNPNQIVERDNPGFRPYFDLADRYERYRLARGCPPDRFTELASKYDFGLMLADMEASTLRTSSDEMAGGVGTKLFTYLEAGLPVLVNAEYREMARIVTEHSIGIAVHSRDIATLAERLKSFDRPAALAHIRHYIDTRGMHREIERLIALYERVIAPESED